MLHLIYCNLPCKIIDQSEILQSTCLFSRRYAKIKHMQIIVQILGSRVLQIYIVRCRPLHCQTLLRILQRRHLLLVQRKNPLLNPQNLRQQSKLLDLILRNWSLLYHRQNLRQQSQLLDLMLRQRLLHRHRQVLFQKRQSLLQRRCNLKLLRKRFFSKGKAILQMMASTLKF